VGDLVRFAAGAEEEDGHADGDAVGDLLEDHAAVAVGEVAVDLDAAVDGAGVHDDGLRVEPGGAGLVEAEHARVLAERGEVAARLALVLDAQEHHHLGVGQGGLEVVRDLHTEVGEPVGYEGGGPDQRDGGAHLREGVDVGAGDAAEQDVAEDHDLAAVQLPKVLLHRERVEQALRGMLVGAVARVDHRDVEHLAQVVRGAAGGVAQHDHVGVERLDVLRGIAEGLTLRGAGVGGVERDDVGAQALGRHLEREAGARAGLEEEVDDGLAAQGGDLLLAAAELLLENGGELVDLVDLREAEFLESEQVFAVPGHGRKVQARPLIAMAAGVAAGPRVRNLATETFSDAAGQSGKAESLCRHEK